MVCNGFIKVVDPKAVAAKYVRASAVIMMDDARQSALLQDGTELTVAETECYRKMRDAILDERRS